MAFKALSSVVDTSIWGFTVFVASESQMSSEGLCLQDQWHQRASEWETEIKREMVSGER